MLIQLFKISVLAGWLLCSGFAVQAQNIQFVKYELDNGLKVLLHEDHSTPMVVVSMMYHVGSKNERPDRTGFAHFFEHLLFEGSENVKRGEFDKYIYQAGGDNNANTDNDRTFYYDVLPSNQLALGLWLESERLLHAKVEAEGIEIQRQVVKEERRQSVDNRPYGRLTEEVMKRLFREHPYKWPVIGSMEHLDAARETDYKQFYKDFYRPDNAILCIAGDLDIEQTKKLIDVYFNEIPRGQTPVYRPDIKEQPLAQEIRDTVYDNVQLPAVIFAYLTPARNTRDYYAMKMLDRLLSQGNSSRLYKRLVDKDQLAAATGILFFDLEDPGAFMTYAIANVDVPAEKLEQAMHEELLRLQNELISEREYQKLLNQLEYEFVTANSTMLGIAETLAGYELYSNDAGRINTEFARYREVSRDDLKNAARNYLNPRARVLLYWLPK